MSEREKPYAGSKQRLVLSLDIGTTNSGVAYCILTPGEVPKIHSVTRYPGQEHAAGSPKIPTVMLYDSQGNVRAAGAEALLGENIERAEDEGWLKVDWFKLRLSPSSIPGKLKTSHFPPLPPSKSIVEVFGDMMAYLLSCAERFIKETHPTITAPGVWADIRRSAKFVIAHPNSWDGRQQTELMQAAVYGGLVDNSMVSRDRVVFVTEGEASLHYCLKSGMVPKPQSGFIVADLGGGTLDFSAYRVSGISPLRLEEIAASRTEVEGSTLVTQRARLYIKEKLKESMYGSPEGIAQICERFDETTKRTFRGVEDTCLVQFGSPRDADAAHNIRSGRLKLTGAEVAPFFEPAVDASISAIATQLQDTFVEIETVYTVGGFAASPYLIAQLTERLTPFGITVSTPDGQMNKTVAEGCISFFLNHYVSSRVARVTYLLEYEQSYKPEDPEHVKLQHTFRRMPNGTYCATKYTVLLKRGTSVQTECEFRQQLHDVQNRPEGFTREKLTILAYTGAGEAPRWPGDVKDRGDLKYLCSLFIEQDLIARVKKAITHSDGSVVWRYDVEVALCFGGTQLRAVYWFEEAGTMNMSQTEVLFYDLLDYGQQDDDVEDILAHAVARSSI